MPTNLNPKSTSSPIVLTATGSATAVAAGLPFGMYTGSAAFLSGAALQVGYVYRKLGGDVVDIELTPNNVYAAYEEAVLEYSYIINTHQGKNVLSDVMGNATGTFDHKGDLLTGPSDVNLKYPRFQMSVARKVGDGLAEVAGFGGSVREYSASFSPATEIQDYNLQAIIGSASDSGVDDGGGPIGYAGKVNDRRVIITKVFYKSPRAMWRFYGYYGGVGVVGNYSTYGQFADDSTFEIIPTWQNKLQAIMYEDSIYTRTSHYSYELIDGRLRLYPTPSYWGFDEFDRIWVKFYIEGNAWDAPLDYSGSISGINNMNTLPFENLPYENINSIGKQWIRKYALAVCKEMLGQIRGKFTTVPIPGESVTLNFAELLSQAKEEQTTLKEKLVEMLKEVEYIELVKQNSEKGAAAAEAFKYSPLPIFVG